MSPNIDISLQKMPPANIEAEEAILSAILIDNDSLHDASELLKPDDFYRQANKTIFQAMQSIIGEIDLVTLANHLKEKNQLDEVGGGAALARLVDSVPMATHMESNAKIIKDKAIKRQIIALNIRSAQACYDDKASGQAILDRLQKASTEIDSGDTKRMVKLSEIIQERLEYYDKIANQKKLITGVPTGLKFFDTCMSGFQRSDLILLAGRPGMGKTALGLNFARYATRKGFKIGFFSLEMSKEQLGDRFFASEALVNLSKTRTGQLTPQNQADVVEAGHRMYDWEFYVEDAATIHYQEIHRLSRKHQIKHGLDMIIVDHIQIAKGDNLGRDDLVIGSISRGLKSLAKDLKIPVIALSQLNRKVEDRPDKRPQIADLRQSGSLEQDADVIMFLHRESQYHQDIPPQEVDPVELAVKKFRNGRTDVFNLGFKGETQQFLEIDRHSI